MSALSDELATDSLNRGYASMTDDQVVASLKVRDRPGPVPSKDVSRYLLMVDRWADIELAMQQGNRAAINVIRALQGFDDFNLQDSDVLAVVDAQLSALVTAGLIEAEHKATILALGDNRKSRLEEIGLGQVYWYDVARAR